MGYLRSVGQVERKPKENQDETVYRKVDIESLKYATFNPKLLLKKLKIIVTSVFKFSNALLMLTAVELLSSQCGIIWQRISKTTGLKQWTSLL